MEGKTVLIVEDDPALRRAMGELLRRMGLLSVEAGDGASAIGRLASMRPDLVCVDLVLPESSGYEVCEFIRRSPEHRQTPVLIMSERLNPVDRAYAAEAGGDAFLAKPFSEDALRRQIEFLLEGPHPAALAS